ncbi:hypothetical protein CYMTET_27058, partial [Cymbomonas tetramitiformis]
DGRGAVLAMQRALAQARLGSADVVYLNAHGTSTPFGDAIEQTAIATVFGKHATEAKAGSGLAVSSTKGATGHLLGAAGAVESIFTILALAKRKLPPTLNLLDQSPRLLGNLVPIAAQDMAADGRAALCNSFGFGGTNASLAFVQYAE